MRSHWIVHDQNARLCGNKISLKRVYDCVRTHQSASHGPVTLQCSTIGEANNSQPCTRATAAVQPQPCNRNRATVLLVQFSMICFLITLYHLQNEPQCQNCTTHAPDFRLASYSTIPLEMHSQNKNYNYLLLSITIYYYLSINHHQYLGESHDSGITHKYEMSGIHACTCGSDGRQTLTNL